MPWNDYAKIREIGSGSFGRAVLVSCKRDKKLLVMKEIDLSRMDSRERKATESEVKILSSLSSMQHKHPYIVRYLESFVHEKALCILMEYCEGGDLWQYISGRKRQRSTISEPKVLRWFTQMCLALKYMHDKQVLHRDIKTQNIFLAQKESSKDLGCVKIADFGIAKVLHRPEAMAMTQVGTPYYLSPEICNKQPYNSGSDMWALGCVIYELCHLRVPFEAQELPGLVEKILRAPIQRLPAMYSRELGDIVSALLCRNAAQRPSAPQVLQMKMIQAEMSKMLAENKKPDQENRENQHHAEDPRRGREGSKEQAAPVPNQRPRSAPLRERNHRDGSENRNPSKPSSRAPSRDPSPHRKVADQILRPRAPSADHGHHQPNSARDYQHHHHPQAVRHNQPHSGRR